MEISIEHYMFSTLSGCNYETRIITLGTEFKKVYGVLSAKQFDKFISDTITHEFIHKLLMELFDLTTSKLFDTIEHLIGDYNLKEYVFECIQLQENNRFPMTWHNSIISEGMNWFKDDYHIDNISLIQSYLLCNSRFKGVE